MPLEEPLVSELNLTKEKPASARKIPHSVRHVVHLIGNAHIDLAWHWDWREGMLESISTCRTMCALMREYPEFRFNRGEGVIYDFIERNEPELFAEIAHYIEEGRWGIVGGNWLQPDCNLPSTATLLRNFIRGKRYFREKFNREVKTSWSADCFGHSEGMPDILASVGFENIAFTRPQYSILPIEKQAFWWRGRSGSRILAYRPYDGWYSSERGDIERRLDICLERADIEGLYNVGFFYGLGNHGGGPTRAHFRQFANWAQKHHDVEICYSTLDDFFAHLRQELTQLGEDFIPSHDGELNYCLRGVYSAVSNFKYAYRRAEAALLKSERTAAVCRPLANAHSIGGDSLLAPSWDSLLFNTFHDILPGTCIERAYDDQFAQIGSVLYSAQKLELAVLGDLASKVDTRAGAWPLPEDQPEPKPILLWNANPWPVRQQIEVEASLDYRPLWTYENRREAIPLRIVDGSTGNVLAHQVIPEEHDSFPHAPIRLRAIVPVELPGMGWKILQMGLDPENKLIQPKAPQVQAQLHWQYETGASSIRFLRNGSSWLSKGVEFRLYDDPWGSWGGMGEEEDSFKLRKLIDTLHIVKSAVLEEGPFRWAVWVRFEGENCASTVEATFLSDATGEVVEVRVRALLADRNARLKMIVPAIGADGRAEYAVPGGHIVRNACGEVPGGRWVRAGAGDDAVGFASDALYNFETTKDELRATIARSARYASDVRREAAERPWQHCSDQCEHVFRVVLTSRIHDLPRLADLLADPITVLPVPANTPANPLPPEGSLATIAAPQLRLLACIPEEDGVSLQLQNASEVPLSGATFVWNGKTIKAGDFLPSQIKFINLN